MLSAAVVMLSAGLTWAVVRLCEWINPAVGAAAAVAIAWTTLAARGLD